MADQILISGMGAISAAGLDKERCVESMFRGERNAGRTNLFPTTLDLPAFQIFDTASRPGEMRTVTLLNHALAKALDEARLPDRPAGTRVGVCIGTTVACQLNDIGFYAALKKGEATTLDACDIFLKSNLAERVAQTLGAEGPTATVTNACSSGADAIGLAYHWLRAGLCDVVIAGGADELSQIPFCGFHSLGVTSVGLCMPFDGDRTGLNLGEAAGVMVLETAEHAARRGKKSSLFLCGYGASADAHHLTAPHPEGVGLARAIQAGLAGAGIAPDAVAFINAHGTGTRDNDNVEGKVLSQLFEPGTPYFSTKGYTGHTLGAAGAIEAIFSALHLQAGRIPASAGLQQQDPDIPGSPTRMNTAISGSYAISTSLAFGGNNAALVLGCRS